MQLHVFGTHSSDVVEIFTRSTLANLAELDDAGRELGVPLTLDVLRTYLTETLRSNEPYSYASGHDNLIRLRALAWLVLRRDKETWGDTSFRGFLANVEISLADIRFSYEVEVDGDDDPKDGEAEQGSAPAS